MTNPGEVHCTDYNKDIKGEEEGRKGGRQGIADLYLIILGIITVLFIIRGEVSGVMCFV